MKPEIIRTIEEILRSSIELAPCRPTLLDGLMVIKANTPKYAVVEDDRLIGLNLASIDLNDERWKEIMEALEKANVRLQALNLSKNKLKEFRLPPSMIDDLKELELKDNPLRYPDEVIIKQGPAAVLNFLKDAVRQGIREVYEVKMLIVGEGQAGKTTLWRKLQNIDHPVPDPQEESTVGIGIKEGWEFEHLDLPDVPFLVNLWDFGGQEIQYMTHQFFLTRRSFYVLLADGRREAANFPYWLKIIDLLGCEPDQPRPLPVFVVFNRKGNIKPFMPYDPEAARKDFPRLDIQLYDVDFAIKDYRLTGLPAAINDILCHQIGHLPLEIPIFWDEVRNELYEMRKTISHIDFKTFEKVCMAKGIDDEATMLNLSQLLHDLGVILHYQEDMGLREFIVLNPVWAVNGVYEILRHKDVEQNQGRFDMGKMEEIWQGCKYTWKETRLLRDLMLKDNFEVCFETTENGRKIYIAPQLLPPVSPHLDWTSDPHTLRYTYQYPFMPKGIAGRLIVRLHEHIESKQGKKVVWEKGMVLKKDGCRALVKETEEVSTGLKLITIEVKGGTPENRRFVLRDIRKELHHIHLRSFHSLRYEEKIPCCCDECISAETPFFFELIHLNRLKDSGIPTERCKLSLQDVNVKKLLGEVFPSEDGQRGKKTVAGSTRKLFFSYSKNDRPLLDELLQHSTSLRRSGKVQPWEDSKLLPGEEWDETIKRELTEADIIVLLISSKALATDYIWDVEMQTAIKRHKAGEARVVPVILKFCDWTDTQLGELNALPAKGQPITSAPDRDEAWLQVVQGIKRVIDDLNSKS